MNKKSPIKLTFDVELWTEGVWMQPYITPDLLEKDPFPASIKKILNSLQQYDSRATFFVTLAVAEKYPNVLRDIAQHGHELGLHGPQHKRLRDYNPDEFRNDCITLKRLIEQASSAKACGFRAAHFSLEEKTMWVLPILAEIGITYDSSVFPMNMGEYGLAETPLEPYEIIPGLTEIPLSIATFGKIKIPFAGGIYFRFLPFFIFKFLLKQSAKHSTPVIYFHPQDLDPHTPKITQGPRLRRLVKYWGIKKSFNKFEKILEQFQGESLQ